MTWLSIVIAGIVTYFMRMTMVVLVDRDLLGERVKAVLAYVPSAVFPSLISEGICKIIVPVFITDLVASDPERV